MFSSDHHFSVILLKMIGRSAKMFLMTLILSGCACVSGQLHRKHGVRSLMALQEYNRIYENFFRDDETDYEIVYLSQKDNQFEPEIVYDINVFGREINLRLIRNSHLFAPNFLALLKSGNESTEIEVEKHNNCYYIHKDENLAAGISLCKNNLMEGLLFLADQTLEIHPLFLPTKSFYDRVETKKGVPHIVRKTNRAINQFLDDALYIRPQNHFIIRDKRKTEAIKNMKLTIEVALFVDEPAYKIFAPFFNYDDQKLCDMFLAYINGVQALYHHPSLGKSIDIVLIKMEIFKKQPEDLPHYDGERNQLLESFCFYNEKQNPKDDSTPEHWDMGLYVSGLNFFTYENGRRNDMTMGLATVNGVCTEKYNCIIAEFGTTNVFGKPYPSAGFTSVYILAHEIGHNIGMHHDSLGNNCPKDGFIMSPSRGTNGETTWSPCSAQIVNSMEHVKCLNDAPTASIQNLDHSKYKNNPGLIWKAKKQCEILIRDSDAQIFNPERLHDICENLQCRTPHRDGFYFAGPALEGTDCGENKWCQGGKCIAKAVKPVKIVKGGWSDWIPVGDCQSECIKKSIGYQSLKRTCSQPKPINTAEGCEGATYDVQLCNDDKICQNRKRKTINSFATEKCQEFANLLSDLDMNANGMQAVHEPERLWMACAIFCKRKDTKMYYTPRLEFNDLNTNPYFPDGTWCHNDGKMNYYCVQHHCLPENFKYIKGFYGQEDIAFPQNAAPTLKIPSKQILQYLGLDLNGKPLLKTLKPDHMKLNFEDEWTDKDYLEIPNPDTLIHH